MTPTAYSRLTNKQSKTVDPCQPCSACQGLECLCRPRFFSGQLLTETDLNRLEKYIVDKNKLHTRFLHGWGVACGLEVVCDPCGNQVVVRPGYAVSPCGDDIIVCQETGVDVCDLISNCCNRETPECDPPRRRPEGCDDLERQWILSICYDEYPSRNLPSLTASCGCGGKCGSGGNCNCGGGKGKGCGCGGSTAQKSAAKTGKARQPVQCEPVLTCEAFRFVLKPVDRSEKTTRGALAERFLACIQRFTDSLPAPPPANATVPQIRTWCCEVREALLNIMSSAAITECSVYDELQTLCPVPGPDTTPQQYLNDVASALLVIAIRIFQSCFCSALLPPCPEPAMDNCVPIATVTVRGSKCRVIRICNLEGRKFLTTFPNLQYWLSWLPLTRQLRDLLNRLCCTPIRLPDRLDLQPGTAFREFPAARNTPGTTFAAAASTYSKRNSDAPKGFAALGIDALGVNGGKPLFDSLDLQNPAMSLLFEELAAPLLSAELPASLTDLAAAAGADRASSAASSAYMQQSELDALRTSVQEMQQQIKRQELTIDALVRRLPTNPDR